MDSFHPTPAPAQHRENATTSRPGTSPFAELGLTPELVRAVTDEGYSIPTPVQAQVIPHALAGVDVLACAQTGTGKTAAFVLPLLQRLSLTDRRPGAIRTLILTPTRELASQIGERVSVYGRHLGVKFTVIFGGVSQFRQEQALRRAPEVLIATPGRLLDLMRQRIVRLDGVTDLVLDEADRMLDMGFINDVRTICAAVPARRQTLLFSATMPAAVSGLANAMLKNPVRVSVAPQATTASGIAQSVVFVNKQEKRFLLEHMLRDEKVLRALIFTSTKHRANRLAEQLARAGIESAAIHGNKSQGARERALEAFRRGTSRVLVATDVASRGIDVDGISHVINFDLPNTPESYVHRIGRTGRAGASGEAISFCDPAEEKSLLVDIERLIRQRLPINAASSVPAPSASSAAGAPSPRAAQPQQPKQTFAPQGRRSRDRGPRRGAHRWSQ
jgi:ATP-dependent RNA helicase RhlE